MKYIITLFICLMFIAGSVSAQEMDDRSWIEKWVTDIIAQEAAVALQKKINAKLADIATNLPSWSEISGEYEQLITDAQSAKDTENIKAVATTVIQTLRRLKKAERILYWLAKDSQI